jgi:uncharacterized protein YndB with AHSA1/START domain
MTTATHSLRLTRTIHADQETLFRAWTDPKELEHWWRMEGPGWSFAEAQIDLRAGGSYRLGMTDPQGKRHVAVGVYREIQRPTLLAFTWEWEDPASKVGETLVRVEFKNAGEHSTDVILTHERFTNPDKVTGHEQGWTQLLRLLEAAFAPNPR